MRETDFSARNNNLGAILKSPFLTLVSAITGYGKEKSASFVTEIISILLCKACGKNTKGAGTYFSSTDREKFYFYFR